MEQGQFVCTCPAYGYDLIDGEMVINQAEAAIIRRTFDLYMKGYGFQSIAKLYNDEKVPRRYGKTLWHAHTIRYILTNEKYIGDSLTQKSYSTDTLPYRRLPNNGKYPKYYVKHNHEEIIDRDTFNAVQKLIAERNNEPAGKVKFPLSGKVSFHYKNFLGYRKGEDGKPVIDIEQAEVIRFIYDRYLAGDSMSEIAKKLNALKILTPGGKDNWSSTTIRSILNNEKYKGDAIINKTFVVDCISKQVKLNNGERKKYYVKNNHPAIIDDATFAKVQEELTRRSGKKKVKQVGAKTELGKYCGKYALTELLVCGECKTPYRRCTWTVKGKKKIVWRCISRLDFGKKYCHNSPTIEEGVLHEAIMEAIQRSALLNRETLQTLKEHIRLALGSADKEENSIDIEFRIAQINAGFNSMIDTASADNMDGYDENRIQQLINEKNELQEKLRLIHKEKGSQKTTQDRLDSIYTVIDGLKNCPMTYNDEVVRKLIECVVIESKNQIKVVFRDGTQMEQTLQDENIHWLTNFMLQ
ncbi:TPA: recombinase family protein [Candidatus Scatousia excrementigallinarum]|uniref:Recombinase family protein n=1 Tax=Candidatus Scatousia excrementigallinarum TaxID=2840935 RepID=A0A9D1EWK0_9BACT|nr:recombinase family protein [Candidatus Scatousia excrementigallinarum]